ncbi:esterase [Mesorhizobium loti]|nr:alpha/beta hydrolase [Mesorhizobium loti]PLP57056.1 esterase [Mesorhizobium loti]
MDRGKYATLLDPEYWVYIDRVNARHSPAVVDLPVEQERVLYDEMAAAFHVGRPAGVETEDGKITLADRAIPFRRYRLDGRLPQAAAILYFHGGGFVFGGLDSHDDICADLCGETGFAVISVDYRLAPEHLHPAAFEDAVAAFDWLEAGTELPIVLCGESAGGNLAAAVAHATRRRARPAVGQVLIYPSLGGDHSTGSYVEHVEAPLLSTADLDFYKQVRTGHAPQPDDATLEPLCDSDFAGLPPTVIITAECDPLSSDGETYRDQILAAGGEAAWLNEKRLTHSFLRARKSAPRAGEAMADIVAAVRALGEGRWPY